MNDDKLIELRVLIQNVLGMPEYSVRPADESQPIDGSDYAIVQLSDTQSKGWASGGLILKQSGTVALTIDFMGDNAKQYANQLSLAMQSRYAVDTLLSLDMGYLECSPARDLTALELERVKRYQVKLQLSYLSTYQVPTTVPPDYQEDKEFAAVPIGLITEP